MRKDKIKQVLQDKVNSYNRYNMSGEADPQGMEASVYNNLINRPMVELLPQGPAPELDETPASEEEMKMLIEEMIKKGIR